MVKEDSVWALMIEEARNLVDVEPDMMSFVQRSIERFSLLLRILIGLRHSADPLTKEATVGF